MPVNVGDMQVKISIKGKKELEKLKRDLKAIEKSMRKIDKSGLKNLLRHLIEKRVN